MRTTPSQIDAWLGKPSEDENLEFKEAKKQYDEKKLLEYCVAIANEGGGHLLLGVSDTPPRSVVSTQAFPNLVKIKERLFAKLRFRVNAEEVKHPKGRVVIFHIPSRPSGTAYDLEGKYLMRSGSSLVPMSEDRLREIFAEAGDSKRSKAHEIEERARNLLKILEKEREDWLKSLDQDYAVREAPTQILGLFTIAIPVTPVTLKVFNHPDLAPATPSITFEAAGTQSIDWPWGKETSATCRIPFIAGERRDRIFDTEALFDRVYDDGAIGLGSVHTNAQRGLILPGRRIYFNIAYFMLQLIEVSDTVARVRAAAGPPELKYTLFTELHIVGQAELTLFRDLRLDDEFFSGKRLWLPVGCTPLPQRVIGDERDFRAVINELVSDLLRATGFELEHDWNVELVEKPG
jgi:hypothetical protein